MDSLCFVSQVEGVIDWLAISDIHEHIHPYNTDINPLNGPG